LTEAPLAIFTISAALLLGMPGPTNAVLAAAGAARGLRGAPALLGAEIGGYAIALFLLLSLDGLAGSFRAEIGLALRMLATGLLLVTACKMWNAAGLSGGSHEDIRAPGALNVFLLTLFNPKVLILGFAMFPPAMARSGAAMPAILLAAVILLTGLGWIAAGAATRKLPGQPVVAVARLSSLVIGGFACYLAVTVAIELMSPVVA
jgi:threonine/homoserine/homoserine lactone efflux protein